MTVKLFNQNKMRQNVYLYYNEETRRGVLIDAGGCARVADFLEENKISVETILLTHGHFDHIYELEEMDKIAGDVAIWAHRDDLEMLAKPELNLSTEIDKLLSFTEICILYGDAGAFRVLHTPGHTQGSVCYYDEANGVLFSGDTLFRKNVGRTDLYGGDSDRLIRSIQEELFVLPDDVKVYPGHGPSTTIGYEKANNPFVRQAGIS